MEAGEALGGVLDCECDICVRSHIMSIVRSVHLSCVCVRADCWLLGLGPSEGLMTDALLTTARVPQATGS